MNAPLLAFEQSDRKSTHQKLLGNIYYRHNSSKDSENCSFKGIRGDEIEPAVLNHLYNAFLDEPAFNAAVKRAMPTGAQRAEFVKERDQLQREMIKSETKIGRLVDAILNGASADLLISKQVELISQKQAITDRLQVLNDTIAHLPSIEQTQQAAMLTRLALTMKYKGRDWRKLSHDDVKEFLLHLFGETGKDKKNRNGINVVKDRRGKLIATFAGQVEFRQFVSDGCSRFDLTQEADRMFDEIRREFDSAVKLSKQQHNQQLRPSTSNKPAVAPKSIFQWAVRLGIELTAGRVNSDNVSGLPNCYHRQRLPNSVTKNPVKTAPGRFR